jgi:acyl-CoA hydrolase
VRSTPGRTPAYTDPAMSLTPRRWQESATETVQVVLPNDSNPLGFILGGTVMHLIDITGAIACHRHTNTLALTAAVDGLEFVHPIKVGDMIILKSRVSCTFRTSLEVEVEVFSEEILTGARRLTSRAYLTFVSIDAEGRPQPVAPLLIETSEDEARCREAHARRAERLAKRTKSGETNAGGRGAVRRGEVGGKG